MKNMTKIFVAIAAVVAVGLVAAPSAQAACGNAYLIGAKPIVSNPAWCGVNGCYTSASPGGSISDNFNGVFWSMTSGNLSVGAGDDNGAFDSGQWTYEGSYLGYGTYYYAAGLQVGVGGLSWAASAQIDGCIDNAGLGTGSCTCMALFDEWGGVGYFALLSDQRDALSNHDLGEWTPGDFTTLQPIPAPTIVGSTGAGLGVDLTLLVDPPAGQYLDPACGPCGNIQYRVVSSVVNRGDGSPASRNPAGFTGPASDPTPVGSTSALNVPCGNSDQEVWIATQLIFDSGFETFVVSGDTLQVNCGTNLADPVDLDVKPRPTKRPGKPRIDSPRRR